MPFLWTHMLRNAPKKVNHASACVGHYIYSFGGYCSGEPFDIHSPIEVHRLNTRTLEWTNLTKVYTWSESEYDVPFNRYGHTVVADGHKIYLWGGRDDDAVCNILYEFNTYTNTWSRPKVKGDIPLARDGHSATINNKRMYIFGGFESETESFSQQVHCIDLIDFRWRLLHTNGEPPYWCDFPTLSCINNTLYVFGGRSDIQGHQHSNNEIYYDSIRKLDLDTLHWEEIKLSPKSSPPPIGRRSHSAFVYNGCLYIFGGYNGNLGRHFNDLHRFDPVKKEWYSVSTSGGGPCPRRRQCCVLIGSKLYLFGGTSPISHYDDNSSSHHSLYHSGPQLEDQCDLYVLDLAPSLKTLASLECIKYELDTSQLPKTVKDDIQVPGYFGVLKTISRPSIAG